VFGGTSPGSAEIIGPNTGARHQFVNTSPARLELRMEGVRYAHQTFPGEVTVTLRANAPGASAQVRSATVRIAPWMVPSHLDKAERVFVVDLGPENMRFRTDLRRLVTAAGCQLSEFPSRDRWIQDCMEFGFSTVPGKGLRTVFRALRGNLLSTFPRSLLGPDLGYTDTAPSTLPTSLNFGGNIEVTPRVNASGKSYPAGRIYYGSGPRPDSWDSTKIEEFDPLVRDFLERQVVQKPIALDTNWLTVGHVDEVVTVVPAPGLKGFRLLLASPRRAYAILDRLALSSGSARMLVGRSLRRSGRVPVEKSVTDFLALQDDFNPELKYMVSAGLAAHSSTTLRRYNDNRQADVDRIRKILVAGLELTDADIIEIPAIFMPNPITPHRSDALIAGMVNMLVVNGHCIIPKPFGPIVGGDDQFEKDVREQLTPLGITVSFLDCWEEYHIQLGEVHCGTNVLREARTVKWWEFVP
jgi:protein-arginine deiminase